MPLALITGSSGLIGSESVRFFAGRGFDVVGVENDMRARFFGAEASTAAVTEQLRGEVEGFRHVDLDIRDREGVEGLFARHGREIELIVHTAAQPSHDWAASDPHTDFSVNAVGTLNLLQAARRHVPDATFIFTSTNKVYGDRPNFLRWSRRTPGWSCPRITAGSAGSTRRCRSTRARIRSSGCPRRRPT